MSVLGVIRINNNITFQLPSMDSPSIDHVYRVKFTTFTDVLTDIGGFAAVTYLMCLFLFSGCLYSMFLRELAESIMKKKLDSEND